MLICLNAVAECGQSEREEMENCMMELSAGNTAAMEPLYRIANPSVYAFALSLLKSSHDAEEIAQECFVRAYLGAAGYRPQGKPMAWLMTIARNEALQLLRERRRTVAMTPEDWQEQFSDRPDFSQEDLLTLRALLETLSDEERQIVSLHALGGLKHREIADMLELALPTVLSKYHRAMKKLGKAAEEAE